MLELKGLHVSYGAARVLRGISLEVPRGEIVSLVGSNGAGKTTSLRAIAGLIRPAEGHIYFQGKCIDRASPSQRVEMGIVQVPEGRELFTSMTVLDNLYLGASSRRGRSRRGETLGEVLALFPALAGRRAQIAGTLSGGEGQMLAIGRALMALPEILVLDEPSLGLAPLVVGALFRAIREINRLGITVLLVEQHVQHALRMSHRAYVLAEGEITLTGTGPALLEHQDLRTMYLGM